MTEQNCKNCRWMMPYFLHDIENDDDLPDGFYCSNPQRKIRDEDVDDNTVTHTLLGIVNDNRPRTKPTDSCKWFEKK